MTFEEFFQKKKIDLAALGTERPQLLEEFQKHFVAMGEKSFDHTKKYWFNRLRKSYPLKQEPEQQKVPVVAEEEKQETEPEKPVSKAAYKPRFKAGNTPSQKKE